MLGAVLELLRGLSSGYSGDYVVLGTEPRPPVIKICAPSL